jgi:hypothetical protein
MSQEPFVLSIETDVGTYQHGFHLGTDERWARSFAEDSYLKLQPKIGTVIKTVALMRNKKILDVFDGTWFNSL